MNKNFQKVRERFVEGMGELASSLGFTSTLGQIYGLLFLSPSPLCLDEIAQELGISKGSVSINIRQLGRVGMVRQVWVKGERKNYYQAETNFGRIINTRLKEIFLRRLEMVEEIVGGVEKELKLVKLNPSPEEKKILNFFSQRIKRVKETKRWFDSLLSLTESFLK